MGTLGLSLVYSWSEKTCFCTSGNCSWLLEKILKSLIPSEQSTVKELRNRIFTLLGFQNFHWLFGPFGLWEYTGAVFRVVTFLRKKGEHLWTKKRFSSSFPGLAIIWMIITISSTLKRITFLPHTNRNIVWSHHENYIQITKISMSVILNVFLSFSIKCRILWLLVHW